MGTIKKIANKTIVLVIIALSFSFFPFNLVRALSEEESIYKYNALENKVSNLVLADLVPPVDQEDEDSIYKYNALENKTSFADLVKGEEIIDTGMLHVDITEELQDLTLKQDFSVQQIENAMSSLEKSEVKNLLLGPDLATLKFQLVQIKEEMTLLAALRERTEDNTIAIQIDNQIEFLKKEQKKVEDFILKQKNEFSLFGWVRSVL